MYNPDTELLFPLRVIPYLQKLRGEKWHALVLDINTSNTQKLEKIAFVLLMVRLDGCTTCNTHSFRAMRGCTQCAQQAVRRFKGSDDDLIKLFDKAHIEAKKYLEGCGLKIL